MESEEDEERTYSVPPAMLADLGPYIWNDAGGFLDDSPFKTFAGIKIQPVQGMDANTAIVMNKNGQAVKIKLSEPVAPKKPHRALNLDD